MKQIAPRQSRSLLKKQSRVLGQRTWLVRAPPAAVSSMWKSCPLGNEADTSLNHTQQWNRSLLASYHIPLVYIVRLSFTADHPKHQHQHQSSMQKASERMETKSHVWAVI